MAPQSSTFADTFRSFWHAVTSNDRHATYDSAQRTSQSRHGSFTTTSSIMDPRIRLSDSMSPATGHDSKSPIVNGRPISPPASASYSPGMRSAQRQSFSTNRERDASIDKAPAEIQLQSFNDGLPPAPPVIHSWKRIERWLEDNFGELFDNLCSPATDNDLNELEHELNCILPNDIRESLQIHDGQERGGRPTGVIFGCMLLDCEEIVEEWSNWRAVNEQYLMNSKNPGDASISIGAIAGPSSPSTTSASATQNAKPNGVWREDLLEKQDSQPPNAVQKAYAHTAWIPLARDWGGNCLAVDLEPGPMGTHGQIIIFGRDYDCKFVVARSWASFMASLADDLTSGSDKVFIDEESSDLKFKPFKRQGVEPPYLEILRWRCDQKYGRRPLKKRLSGSGSPGLRIDSNVQGSRPDRSISPYSSPGGLNISDRGRSPHRSNGKAPVGVANSPMRPHVSSPLARVAEESMTTQPLSVKTDGETLKGIASRKVEKLISVDTPRASGDFPIGRLGASSPNKENVDPAKKLPSTMVTSSPIKAFNEPLPSITPITSAPKTEKSTEASTTSSGAEIDSDIVLVDEFKTVAI